MAASDNPAFQEPLETDPTLFATAYKRNRFYMLTRREPADDTYAQGGQRKKRERQTEAHKGRVAIYVPVCVCVCLCVHLCVCVFACLSLSVCAGWTLTACISGT
jgi:hypothetical protein